MRPLVGKTVTDRLVTALAGHTGRYVVRARTTLSTSATQQYRAFLDGQRPIQPPTLTRFTPDAWRGSVNNTLPLGEPIQEKHIEDLGRKAQFWARDAERGTLIHYSQKDKRVYAWARIDPEPPSCPFCTVLISRRAVYHTQSSALLGETGQFHVGCTCTAVLVSEKNPTSFEGYQQQQDALAEYIAARKATSKHDLAGIVAAMQKLRDDTGGKTP